MTQTHDPSLVIAYYSNPKSGKVERHQMQSVIFEEASRGMYVGAEFVTSEENKNWTPEPPEGADPRDIVDLTPQPFRAEIPPAQPPPAFPSRSPEVLKRAQAPAPTAPPKRRG
jgi:hypothetical protein